MRVSRGLKLIVLFYIPKLIFTLIKLTSECKGISMNFFSRIKESLFGSNEPKPQEESEFDLEKFIYIKLPGNIGPLDRGELFEDQIDPVLEKEGLGSVSGGGSSLGDEQPDGSRQVEFCGIDVDVTNCDRAREVLRDLLPKLNAPIGTELQFTKAGKKLQDRFNGATWTLEESRAALHPGFGV